MTNGRQRRGGWGRLLGEGGGREVEVDSGRWAWFDGGRGG
jgi:hypothetical protein